MLSAAPVIDSFTVSSFDDLIDEHGHHDGTPEFCVTPAPAENIPAPVAAAPSAAPPFPLANTFQLHSLPGASKVIYLDFNGHTTTGTLWNNGRGTIATPAYSFEGDATFTAAEQERIQRIWQRVAEDFLPFQVDVTTQDPGTANLINSGGSDTQWGVRVVIGGNSSWLGQGAGGVAYVGSFSWNTDTPAFVFEDNLADGHEHYTAEAISHEIGHSLGLDHDGRTSPAEGYYQGHGSGATGWAPIMGVGYYQSLTQWSKGEYANANNTQDDLAIITTSNGFGYRTDDHGNTRPAASALALGGLNVSGQGIIERNTDVDVFSFDTGAGAINLTVDPAALGANLDILAELYNAAGSLIVSANPLNSLSASLSAVVTAGQYFLHISGVGQGNPATTGYSDYGSLGAYSISGTVLNAPAVPDIVAPQATLSAGAINTSGGATHTFTVTYSDNVAVDVSSLDSQDLLVTGPNGFSQNATFVSVNVNADGTPRTATYRVNAPGGTWDSTDNGTYSVAILDEQVSDTSDNFVAAGTLGAFVVSAPIAADRFEANDTFATARNFGNVVDRTENNLTIHAAGNQDYYIFRSVGAGTLVVRTTTNQALGNVNLYVYNSSQTLIGSSAGLTSNEQVTVTVAAGQTYYIRVAGSGNSTSPDYDLEIDGPTPVGSKVGTYVNGTWTIDLDGNRSAGAGDDSFTLGSSTVVPVVGRWGGGAEKVGTFSNGTWRLDLDGDRVIDATYTFGAAGTTPVVGDWNGDGADDFGTFNNGLWVLDLNGNRAQGSGDVTFTFGSGGAKPVVGRWGGGADKVGTFVNGTWRLDLNGNRAFGAGDGTYTFGNSTMTPVVGDWDGNGTDEIGTFVNGTWNLDLNGNRISGTSDTTFVYGGSGMRPIVGKWSAATSTTPSSTPFSTLSDQDVDAVFSDPRVWSSLFESDYSNWGNLIKRKSSRAGNP